MGTSNTLVSDYRFELVEDHHSPGSGRYGVKVILPVDISAVLPFLNAVLDDTVYDHNSSRYLARDPLPRIPLKCRGDASFSKVAWPGKSLRKDEGWPDGDFGVTSLFPPPPPSYHIHMENALQFFHLAAEETEAGNYLTAVAVYRVIVTGCEEDDPLVPLARRGIDNACLKLGLFAGAQDPLGRSNRPDS